MPKKITSSLLAALLAIGALVSLDAAAAAARSSAAAPTAKQKRAARKKRAARRRAARRRRSARHATPRPAHRTDSPPAQAAPPAPPAAANGAASGAAPGTAPPASSGTGTGPGPATAPRLFAPDSVWNRPLAPGAPLDIRSAELSAALSGEVQREVGSRVGPWINTDSYGVPVYTVGPDVPAVRVNLDIWSPQLQSDFDAVPIPDGARPADGVDRHLAIYQPSTDTMWEFWLAGRDENGWHARWGGKMTNVSSNPGYFPNPYGASATSLPLMAGLITPAELRSGHIDHALSIAVPNTQVGLFTWPAQRGDGLTALGGIPEGTHFRIDPSVDLSTLDLSPVGLILARAAQTYGIIVRDTSSCVVFYAADPNAMDSNPYPELFGYRYPSQVLEGFPWQSLEVVAPSGG